MKNLLILMFTLILSTAILEAQNNLQVEVSGNPITLLFGVGLVVSQVNSVG